MKKKYLLMLGGALGLYIAYQWYQWYKVGSNSGVSFWSYLL
jgi:hypothetical protein